MVGIPDRAGHGEWFLDPLGTLAPQPLLQRAIALKQDVIDDARGLAMKLRSCVLDDLDAASAIGWFFREFSQAHPGIAICTRITVQDSAIPERLGTACFRIVQELLRNFTEHDRPRTILVSPGRESEQLVLEVIHQGGDENVIAGAAPWRGGAEFVRVSERALMSGGQFSLRPAADGFGTGGPNPMDAERAGTDRTRWRLTGWC